MNSHSCLANITKILFYCLYIYTGTKEDLDYTVDRLKEIVAKLREISAVSEEKGW